MSHNEKIILEVLKRTGIKMVDKDSESYFSAGIKAIIVPDGSVRFSDSHRNYEKLTPEQIMELPRFQNVLRGLALEEFD